MGRGKIREIGLLLFDYFIVLFYVTLTSLFSFYVITLDNEGSS